MRLHWEVEIYIVSHNSSLQPEHESLNKEKLGGHQVHVCYAVPNLLVNEISNLFFFLNTMQFVISPIFVIVVILEIRTLK